VILCYEAQYTFRRTDISFPVCCSIIFAGKSSTELFVCIRLPSPVDLLYLSMARGGGEEGALEVA